MVGTFPFGTGTYRYLIPAVIPPGGAQGSLVMSIQATQLWATGFSLGGNADFSPSPPSINESTSTRGLSFSFEQKFSVKPRAYPTGTKFVELIGKAYFGEGPIFTFRYAVKAPPKPGQCRRVARTTASLAVAAATPEFCGVTLRIDKPKGYASPWVEVNNRVDFTALATGMDVEPPLKLVILWRDPDAPRNYRAFQDLRIPCVVGKAACPFTANSTKPRSIEFQAALMLDADELYHSDVVSVRWVPELKKLSFKYTVPPRLEQKAAAPVEYVNGGRNARPDSWPVDLKVEHCPDPQKNRYLWEFTRPTAGANVRDLPATHTSGCIWRARLPAPGGGEGEFQITLKVDANVGAQKYEGTEKVLLQDFLVIGLGDSLASGEGNPEGGTGAGARWQDLRCDRSLLSYQALTALAIERADPQTSVTFVHLACSGASILDTSGTGRKGGLLAPYEGINPSPLPAKPQLEEAAAVIGGREVDAVLLSAGVNDLEFGAVVGACADPFAPDFDDDGKATYCYDRFFHDKSGQAHLTLRGFVQQRIPTLPDAYLKLKVALQTFGPSNRVPGKRVFITEYPDTLRVGDLCPGLDLRGQSASVITINADEVRFLADEFRTPLNAAIAATGGGADGWTVVSLGGIGFEQHGYCAGDRWVVQRIESFRDQGNENGTLHPNNAGHREIATVVAKALKAQLLPGGKARKPRK